jgi:hypothetical protein
MSAISSAIDGFLREYLDPSLKSEGFKKQRRRYRHVFDARAEHVLVEASRWNQSPVGQFTVMLGAVIPELSRKLYGRTVDLPSSKCSDSGIVTTLGHLMAERKQDIWTVNLTSDNRKEGSRLRAAIEEYGLPWFRQMRTEDGLVEALENDQSRSLSSLQVLVVLYIQRKQQHRAREAVEQILRRRPDLEDRMQRLLA